MGVRFEIIFSKPWPNAIDKAQLGLDCNPPEHAQAYGQMDATALTWALEYGLE